MQPDTFVTDKIRAPIFDSHAHYDDAAFDADRGELLPRLHADGVCGIINCGSSLAACEASVELARRYPFVWASVGIHPEDISGDFPEKRLRELAADKRTVAIGEIGLDYHWDTVPREIQREWFVRQMVLANELGLPVIVHDREAHGDTLELLKKYRPRGVVHCFSGSAEMAREITAIGMYIGIGGVVTFKNARRTVEVAAQIPLDRLLTETDAPYMAPVPHRGERCHSGMIALDAAKIAEIRGISADEVLRAGCENAARLFGILL
jgi:TatD DNase family protein